MTSPPDPSPSGDTTAALAVQVAALRGQVAALKTRLDNDVIGKHRSHSPKSTSLDQ